MRCPACNTENEPSRPDCSNCQAALPSQPPPEEPAAPPAKRRPRRQRTAQQTDTPFSPYAEGCNREAANAYRLSLIGMVPFLGLVLGPLSAWQATRIKRKSKDDPDFTAHTPVRAAVVIGILAGVTQWVGLGLMILGLLLP
jgi:hypothetical protein